MVSIKKSLFIILFFITNLSFSQEHLNDDLSWYEPFRNPKTWVFKSKDNGKEKMIRTGDKLKVYVRRMNPKDKYLTRGILEDIRENQIVIRNKNNEQELIDKLVVKRIIASHQDGLMKNLFGLLLIGIGCIVGGIGLLIALFSIDNQNPGNTNVGTISILFAIAGLLLLAVGMKMMDDNTSNVIVKPFSYEWEITEIGPPVDIKPYNGKP